MPTIAERKEAAAKARVLALQIRDKNKQLDEMIERAKTLRDNIVTDKEAWRAQRDIAVAGLDMNDPAILEQMWLGDTS